MMRASLFPADGGTADHQEAAVRLFGRKVGEIVFPALAVAMLLALQFQLALTRSINWDEFHYLRLVYEFQRGELSVPLQTLHVRLFEWLPDSAPAAVDQIVKGRLVMFAALLVTTTSIVLVARRFAPLSVALICALAYLSFAFVMQHGTAFRADPLAASLCMAALAILTRARLRPAAVLACALLLGAGFMVTIKIVLYVPAFCGIVWLRWNEAGRSRAAFVALAAVPGLALCWAGMLYLWHGAALAPPEAAAAMVSNSGARMFGASPKLVYIYKGAMMSLPFVMLLGATIVSLSGRDQRLAAERIALICLAAPLFTLVVYTNTFPYFYAFILPPVTAALAAGAPLLTRRYSTGALAGVLAGSGLFVWALDGSSRQAEQRAIELAANGMFPEPVAYFDFPGFLPRHHKANFFMTAWGFANYQEAGEAHFVERLATRPVPLLLAVELRINPGLIGVMEDDASARLFHPDDVRALHQTYRRVWGPIHVAGVQLAPREQRQWQIHVPGAYRTQGSIRIDGRIYPANAQVDLARGTVTLAAQGSGAAGLIWADIRTLPSGPPPAEPFWTDF